MNGGDAHQHSTYDYHPHVSDGDMREPRSRTNSLSSVKETHIPISGNSSDLRGNTNKNEDLPNRRRTSTYRCFRPGHVVKLMAVACAFLTAIVVLVICREYVVVFLSFVETADALTTLFILQSLFIAVSFPLVWGFLPLLLTVGYIFGTVRGLVVVEILSVPGIVVSHITTKRLLDVFFSTLKSNPFINGVIDLVESDRGFKVILLLRVTMIPYGLQNGIFAMANVSLTKYCVASTLGLIPMTLMNCYIGSNLRSLRRISAMEQLEGGRLTILMLQILFTIGIMTYVLTKTRAEITKAVANLHTTTITV